MTGPYHLRDNCACGAALVVYFAPGDEEERAYAEELMARWQARHTGDGHVSVRPTVASYVRSGRSTASLEKLARG